MEKKALGRGLDALLPVSAPAKLSVEPQDVLEIELDHILPNRFQPRTHFPEDELEQLADSLRQNGLLQPVVVRRKGDGLYELISGERRWRAAELAGLGKIKALVRNCGDDEAMALALIENLQRDDLNPMEMAHAYHRMATEFEMTQDVIAQRVGRERSSVANLLRLLNLPDEVQQMVTAGTLTTGHAKVLLGMNSAEAQVRLAREIVDRQLSVREAEKRIAVQARGKRSARGRAQASAFQDLEARLQKKLGTKVVIEKTGAGGRIVLHYFSPQEQERLLDILLG
jgi:ParB family chromosome partitioning protein